NSVYNFTLTTGPDACRSPLGGTTLAQASVRGLLAGTPGVCSAGSICGRVTSAETGGPLEEITLQLRDPAGGQVKQLVRTGPGGRYAFTGLAQPSYYVTPAVGRTQSSSPSQASVPVASGPDFVIRGVAASLQFAGVVVRTVI